MENTSVIQNVDKTNYYTVLQCNQDSSFDEIKQNYHSLIKKFHPDKQNKQGTSYSSEQFIIIDKAYKTLSNETLRKEYNALLLQDSYKDNSLIYAEIDKTGLVFNTNGIAEFMCRCGQNIEITQGDVEDEECLIECSECTNCILIK